MQDPQYLQQEERSCKIIYICNKMSAHVRSSIYVILCHCVIFNSIKNLEGRPIANIHTNLFKK